MRRRITFAVNLPVTVTAIVERDEDLEADEPWHIKSIVRTDVKTSARDIEEQLDSVDVLDINTKANAAREIDHVYRES